MNNAKTAQLPASANRVAALAFWNACQHDLSHAIREMHGRTPRDPAAAMDRLCGAIEKGLQAVAGFPVTDQVPDDVARMVVAARVAAFEDHIRDTEVRGELDQASEAFAGRVPWDDDPNNEAEAPADEVSSS